MSFASTPAIARRSPGCSPSPSCPRRGRGGGGIPFERLVPARRIRPCPAAADIIHGRRRLRGGVTGSLTSGPKRENVLDRVGARLVRRRRSRAGDDEVLISITKRPP